MGYLQHILCVLLLVMVTAQAQASEVYLMAFIEPNMAARADGGNPKCGLGIFQPVKLMEGLILSGRVELMLEGRDRDGSTHPVSVRYMIKLRYDHSPFFIEAERFAWNPITHVSNLPPGMKDSIGGGDTMSAYEIKLGVKF